MGVIPESAVPESVASKFVDPADVSGDTVKCPVCKASLSITSITVNDETVYCYKWLSGGYNSTDIT